MNLKSQIDAVVEAKAAASHGADVFHKKLGNAGAGETKRGEAAIEASEKAEKLRRKRLEASKRARR